MRPAKWLLPVLLHAGTEQSQLVLLKSASQLCGHGNKCLVYTVILSLKKKFPKFSSNLPILLDIPIQPGVKMESLAYFLPDLLEFTDTHHSLVVNLAFPGWG